MGDQERAAATPLAAISEPAEILRAFAIEFLTCQRWDVLPRIMVADYVLHVGGYVIEGRDREYRAAMLSVFGQFPGMCVTIHDIVLGSQWAAIRFTEHGASRRDGGRRAAWQGVAVFQVEGGQLRAGWAEEDYFARKRQLRSALCDVIEPPHSAPWDVPVAAPNAETDACARAWLAGEWRDCAISHATGRVDMSPTASLIDINTTSVDALFTAGDRAVFHVTYQGTYSGGLPDIAAGLVGKPVALHAAGILTTRGRAVVDSRVVVDRLGLQRRLTR